MAKQNRTIRQRAADIAARVYRRQLARSGRVIRSGRELDDQSQVYKALFEAIYKHLEEKEKRRKDYEEKVKRTSNHLAEFVSSGFRTGADSSGTGQRVRTGISKDWTEGKQDTTPPRSGGIPPRLFGAGPSQTGVPPGFSGFGQRQTGVPPGFSGFGQRNPGKAPPPPPGSGGMPPSGFGQRQTGSIPPGMFGFGQHNPGQPPPPPSGAAPTGSGSYFHNILNGLAKHFLGSKFGNLFGAGGGGTGGGAGAGGAGAAGGGGGALGGMAMAGLYALVAKEVIRRIGAFKEGFGNIANMYRQERTPSAMGQGLRAAGNFSPIGQKLVFDFTAGLVESVDKLRDFAKQLEDSNFKFAEFSASMSMVETQQWFRDMQMSMTKGNARAASAQRLSEARTRLEMTMMPFETAWAKAKNDIFAKLLDAVVNLEAGFELFLAYFAPFVKKALDKMKDDTPADNVFSSEQMLRMVGGSSGEDWFQRYGRPKRFQSSSSNP